MAIKTSHLYLVDSKVKKSFVISHVDETFGSFTTHAGPQSSIKLKHNKFIKQPFVTNLSRSNS